MKKGILAVVFIAAVIFGGFVGWGVAAVKGEGNTGQSRGTGVGSGIGAIVGVVFVGALLVADKWGKQSKAEGQNG